MNLDNGNLAATFLKYIFFSDKLLLHSSDLSLGQTQMSHDKSDF